MAQITVEGRKVTVSDNFLSMSRAEQDKAVDEIAASMGPPSGGSQFGPRVGGASPKEEAPFSWSGLGSQTVTALAKGAVGAPGIPGDIAGLQGRFNEQLGIEITPERLAEMRKLGLIPSEEGSLINITLPTSGHIVEAADRAIRPEPTTAQVIGGEEPHSFLMRQPENTAEQYADTTGQFVGSSWLGPGSLGMKLTAGATGGIASETAGQMFEGSPNEGLARTIGGFAGVVGPHMVAGARGSHVPRQMVGRAMEGLDEAMLNRADFLRRVAAQQGIDLSWPEALQQASSGGTRLGDLQRVVENSDYGGPTMRQYYANRPQQVDAAAHQQFDRIAPQPIIPERLGPRVQQAADADISSVNRDINAQTRPMYQAAEAQTIPANTPALVNPAFVQAVAELRNNPVLGPRFAHLPDNSIGVIDAAQKLMRSRAEALQVPGQGLNPYEASVTRQARRDVTNEARNQSPEYDAAVQYQRQAKQQSLSPLQEGPTGKLAGATDAQAQTRALFPAQPTAHSDVGVARTIRGIRQTDPQAAEGVVRQHLEDVFNEATQRIQSGRNPFGGAKFAAVIAGNPQQRRNLTAAIRALPNGDILWRGFNRFLNIMEATGRRPAPNSATQFNAQITKDLERGGYGGELATIAGSPQKALSFVRDGYARFRLGRNTAQLARLFTQGNVEEFRTILRSGPVAPRALVAMVRLLAQVGAGTQGAPGSEPVQ